MQHRARHNGRLQQGVMLSLLACVAPVLAEPVGSLRDIAPVAGAEGTAGWEITTDTGTRLRIDLLRADTFRVQAGRGGKLLPSGDKATPVVVPQTAAKVAFQFEQDA